MPYSDNNILINNKDTESDTMYRSYSDFIWNDHAYYTFASPKLMVPFPQQVMNIICHGHALIPLF